VQAGHDRAKRVSPRPEKGHSIGSLGQVLGVITADAVSHAKIRCMRKTSVTTVLGFIPFLALVVLAIARGILSFTTIVGVLVGIGAMILAVFTLFYLAALLVYLLNFLLPVQTKPAPPPNDVSEKRGFTFRLPKSELLGRLAKKLGRATGSIVIYATGFMAITALFALGERAGGIVVNFGTLPKPAQITLIVAVCVAAAVFLHHLKTAHRRQYGLLEIAFSLAVLSSDSATRILKSQDSQSWSAIIGGTSFLVRGLDNVFQGASLYELASNRFLKHIETTFKAE
jgi:hypothetical protein